LEADSEDIIGEEFATMLVTSNLGNPYNLKITDNPKLDLPDKMMVFKALLLSVFNSYFNKQVKFGVSYINHLGTTSRVRINKIDIFKEAGDLLSNPDRFNSVFYNENQRFEALKRCHFPVGQSPTLEVHLFDTLILAMGAFSLMPIYHSRQRFSEQVAGGDWIMAWKTAGSSLGLSLVIITTASLTYSVSKNYASIQELIFEPENTESEVQNESSELASSDDDSPTTR
jgi:hypothetical protein